MIKIKLLFISIFTWGICSAQSSVKDEQKNSQRVKQAYSDTYEKVKDLFVKKNLSLDNAHIFLRLLKEERTIELYAKGKNDEEFTHIKNYYFCVLSGKLGPKRQQGDWQVPEGVYFIDRFNAWSAFYLSLGINYPNAYDKKMAINSNPGGDIFIHGNCVSVGCVPITDKRIKELYVICLEAENNGQKKIPVHIFPFLMGKNRIDLYKKRVSASTYLFWKNLQSVYDYFDQYKKVPKISISSEGYKVN